MLRWLWCSVLIVGLDQLTKILAEQHLQLFQPVPVMASFNLALMYNTGAAFSFLAGAGGWQRWFFIVLATVISVVLVIWLARLGRDQRLQASALALVLGGAVGNVIDRLLYGHVIDFIQLYYRHWYWPTFNIADAAITVGAVLLIIDTLFHSDRRAADRQDSR